MKQFKAVVEQHEDGFVACPIGMIGVVVGQGDTAYDLHPGAHQPG